jgi:hypothetical protein
MRIFSSCFMFIGLCAVAVFADSAVASVTLPAWLQAVLAIGGCVGVGGASVFTVITRKINAAEKEAQLFKNVIDKDLLLFATVKSVVKDGPLVGEWNDAMDANIAVLKSIKLFGISAKADSLEKLKIKTIVAPAVVKKIEDVAGQVINVVNQVAAAAPVKE